MREFSIRAKVRTIEEYTIIGDIDISRARNLHELTIEYRDTLFGNHALQNLLLNDGDELREGKIPKSYFDLYDATWHRTKIAGHLLALEKLIELATRPPRVVVRMPAIVIPGQEEVECIKTPQGLDYERVDEFQRDWLRSLVTDKIRRYQSRLQEAFDEFNLKYVLTLVFNSLRPPNIGYLELGGDEGRILNRIKEALLDHNVYSTLDNAYYLMANRFVHMAGELYKELSQDEFGKNFLLSSEEEGVFLKMVYGGLKFRKRKVKKQ